MPLTMKAPYLVVYTVEDFVLSDVDGVEHRFSDLTGEWTLVYFITTWCPYCVAEAPY